MCSTAAPLIGFGLAGSCTAAKFGVATHAGKRSRNAVGAAVAVNVGLLRVVQNVAQRGEVWLGVRAGDQRRSVDALASRADKDSSYGRVFQAPAALEQGVFDEGCED